MWVTLLLILKDVLSRFAFRYQNVFYFEFVEKGLKFVNQSEIGLHCIIQCEIMGYIHKLNRIEIRFLILTLQKNHENWMY